MRVRSKSLSRAREVCAGGAGPLTVLRLLTLPAEPENDGSLTQRFPACLPGEGCIWLYALNLGCREHVGGPYWV
jgi:hypothetical protein